MAKFIDIANNTFGRLTALYSTGISRGHSIIWACRCSCGKVVHIASRDLRNGHSQSCGCSRTKHGHTSKYWKSATYKAWDDMKARCLNPLHKSYKNYGGRGIKVCDEWAKSFVSFLHDMGECPTGRSIDRINNNGNYEPSNCRWATNIEQANNRTDSRYITYNGQKRTVAQWAKTININRQTLYARLFLMKWPIEVALNSPVHKKLARYGGER